jgi:hypothetical protein
MVLHRNVDRARDHGFCRLRSYLLSPAIFQHGAVNAAATFARLRIHVLARAFRYANHAGRRTSHRYSSSFRSRRRHDSGFDGLAWCYYRPGQSQSGSHSAARHIATFLPGGAARRHVCVFDPGRDGLLLPPPSRCAQETDAARHHFNSGRSNRAAALRNHAGRSAGVLRLD